MPYPGETSRRALGESSTVQMYRWNGIFSIVAHSADQELVLSVVQRANLQHFIAMNRPLSIVQLEFKVGMRGPR